LKRVEKCLESVRGEKEMKMTFILITFVLISGQLAFAHGVDGVVGFTDAYGRFLFLPDKKGLSVATVNDGMGHMLKLNLMLNNNLTLKNQKEVTQKALNFSRREGIFFGLSLIFFICGALFWIKGKKQFK